MACQRQEVLLEKEGNANAHSLQTVPTEILLYLFDYLDYGDLMHLSCVCRRFSNIINEDTTWSKRSYRALVTNLIDTNMKKW